MKTFLKIIVVAIIVFIIGAIGYFYSNKKSDRSDAKQEEITMKIGDREGSFLLQKINSDNLEGLWFKIYPVARDGDTGKPKTLRIGDDIGYSCEGISEKLSKIDFPNQTATFIKITGEPSYGGCPI